MFLVAVVYGRRLSQNPSYEDDQWVINNLLAQRSRRLKPECTAQLVQYSDKGLVLDLEGRRARSRLLGDISSYRQSQGAVRPSVRPSIHPSIYLSIYLKVKITT